MNGAEIRRVLIGYSSHTNAEVPTTRTSAADLVSALGKFPILTVRHVKESFGAV
jgi:hypothetical protein